jgi:hypothetical protein
MNIYVELRCRARAKRDKAIESVEGHYRATLDQINRLQRADGKRLGEFGYREPTIKRGLPGTPLKKLGYAAAVERVLMEGKAMRIAEVVMELKSRGYRPAATPQAMSVSVSGAFSRHPTRFSQDDNGKWRVL